ncbi:arsenic resistance protein [Aspergillus brunneoviolaceus CBS 621.78]|uniref:Arsenite efflux transporter n=1 Tax=Aspergillus brunneoviolaceus CBS 621.78 TaxID=1450534 RepID=A0ACD1GIS7_9EURO|nr:putative arsenite efflux transporter [Aspergillus brunneoviolaceus CBS 621.78]RAH49168.1 putative arsenite efflux transporter [Aspergillus brunneoviolaceus CBS 621.78]
MVLFAPVAILLIRIIGGSHRHELTIDYSLAAKSIGVFLGIPLGAAIVSRITCAFGFLKWISPLALIGLLFTTLLLFAAQGKQAVRQIVSVARVVAPLAVYFSVRFAVTLAVTRRCGSTYRPSCTQSFTAANNNFELTIAVPIATFGVENNQALAATIRPLIQVPGLLGLVYAIR